MFAQLFYKHTEDHQDFINRFMNELGSHLKTVARQRAESRKNDPDPIDDMDDDLPDPGGEIKIN